MLRLLRFWPVHDIRSWPWRDNIVAILVLIAVLAIIAKVGLWDQLVKH